MGFYNYKFNAYLGRDDIREELMRIRTDILTDITNVLITYDLNDDDHLFYFYMP